MPAARSCAILSRLSPPSVARTETDFWAEHWKSNPRLGTGSAVDGLRRGPPGNPGAAFRYPQSFALARNPDRARTSPAEALKNEAVQLDMAHRIVLEQWLADLFSRFDAIAGHLIPTAKAKGLKPATSQPSRPNAGLPASTWRTSDERGGRMALLEGGHFVPAFSGNARCCVGIFRAASGAESQNGRYLQRGYSGHAGQRTLHAQGAEARPRRGPFPLGREVSRLRDETAESVNRHAEVTRDTLAVCEKTMPKT